LQQLVEKLHVHAPYLNLTAYAAMRSENWDAQPVMAPEARAGSKPDHANNIKLCPDLPGLSLSTKKLPQSHAALKN
jgi:hypothetical protein